MKPRRKHTCSRCAHCGRLFLHRADRYPVTCGTACARLRFVNTHPDDELPEPDQYNQADRLERGFALLRGEE